MGLTNSLELTSLSEVTIFLTEVVCFTRNTYVKYTSTEATSTKGVDIAGTYIGRAYTEGTCTDSTYAKNTCTRAASDEGVCIGTFYAIDCSEIYSQTF